MEDLEPLLLIESPFNNFSISDSKLSGFVNELYRATTSPFLFAANFSKFWNLLATFYFL